MISKKNLLSISIVGLIVFLLALFSKELGICPQADYSFCLDFSNQLAEVLIPVLALLILSAISFFFSPDVYASWFRFTRWWIPASIILIVATPEYGGGLFNPIQKGLVSIVMSGLFVFISILVILVAYLRLRK